MIRRYALTALFLAISATMAVATPVKAMVTSLQDKTIVLKIDGQKAAWIKKGAMVKINKKLSAKITEVTDTGVTVTSSQAGELKAGDAITFDKSLATSGC